MPFIILLVSLLLSACGEVDTRSYTDDELEHAQNYQRLKSFFYKPERLKKYSEYVDMEIDLMYSSLNDYLRGHRYTYYKPPKEADEIINNIENTDVYHSFGFERYLKTDTLLNTDTLIVSAVYPNSPANTAGLQKRDRLLFADEVALTGDSAHFYAKYDSLFNSSVVFTVLREKNILKLPAMQKEDVLAPTVFLDSLEGVPFITVTEFTVNTNDPKGTYKEFVNALQQIKGTKTAIVDLRNNLGGNVGHCSAMAAELSPPDKELIYDIAHYDVKGEKVVYTNHYFAKDFKDNTGSGLGINWVILMNEYSASCSERFIASVKSSRPETVLIGGTTYGKGIGQIYMKTHLGGLSYITFMQTYFPDGKTFHEVGIEPDVVASPYSDEIYTEALKAVQKFDSKNLAKRFSANVEPPPEHKARKREPLMYLFH